MLILPVSDSKYSTGTLLVPECEVKKNRAQDPNVQAKKERRLNLAFSFNMCAHVERKNGPKTVATQLQVFFGAFGNTHRRNFQRDKLQ